MKKKSPGLNITHWLDVIGKQWKGTEEEKKIKACGKQGRRVVKSQLVETMSDNKDVTTVITPLSMGNMFQDHQ